MITTIKTQVPSVCMLVLAATASAAAEPSVPVPPEPVINLICSGTGGADHEASTIGSLMGGQPGTVERITFEDSVSVRLGGEREEARIPRRIQSAYKEDRNGWFPLVNVQRGEDEITGRIRLHSMYKPRFRLDRITGMITIEGNLGDFSGRCQPYDPATVERKF